MNFEDWRKENVSTFARLMADQYTRRTNESIDFGIKICESPIEKQMYVAMCCVFTTQEMVWGTAFSPSIEGFNTLDHLRKCEGLPAHMIGETYMLACQVPVGKYRADFALRRTLPFKKNRAIISPILIVECDGHDYHERTKEQAQRDKARDREMLGMGLRVIRFTGSEVFRDYWRCATEVLTTLKGMTDQMIAEEVGRDLSEEDDD
jgi:very-short-patch-repair endonuclease